MWSATPPARPPKTQGKTFTSLLLSSLAIIVVGLSSPLAAEEHLVYDGALLRVQPGMRAYAQLRSGSSAGAVEGFNSERLSQQVLHLKRFKRFSAAGKESPVPLSRKTNPCLRATVRNALAKLNVPRTACSPNYALFATATPNDPNFSSQWSHSAMSSTTAWDTSTGSQNVTVVVIDTGVSLSHPDLINNLWVNPNEIAGDGIDNDGNGYVDDINGINSITGTGNPNDDNNHGTHVAGIIGARGNNGVGISGVNWRVSIAAAKFLDASGSGATSDAIKCIQYATNLKRYGHHNVVATNNSWGGGGYSSALASAIMDAASQDILFVAAAGNAAQNLDLAPSYPASYNISNVIAVASTTSSSGLSSFSNYGATTVHIGAPGSSIYSSVVGGYATYSGTSMASPHVAGIAALASSACATPFSASALKNIILSSGTTLSALNGKTITGKLANSNGAVQAAIAQCAAAPTATPTTAPTVTPTATPTKTPTAVPTATPTPTPTPTASPSPTQTPVSPPQAVEPAPTSAPNIPAPTPTPLPTLTPTTEPTPVPTDTPTAVPPTPTSTPSVAPTTAPPPMATAIPQPTQAPFSISASPASLVKAGDISRITIMGGGSESVAPVRVRLSTWVDGRLLTATCPTKRLVLASGSASTSFSTPTSTHYFYSLNYSTMLGSKTAEKGVSVAKPRLAPPTRASLIAKVNLLAAMGNNFCGVFSRSVQAANRQTRSLALRNKLRNAR